jgi:hypothetical protein
MKTPVGRRLLPRFIRLQPRTRKLAILLTGLLLVVIVAAIVFGVIQLVS